MRGAVDTLLRGSQKPRPLRVLSVVAAVAWYCARNAGRLFRLVWFPCLLVAACQIVLDWLALAYPPRLPDWLLSDNFNPPTWLTAAAIAPWGAMAWAFALRDMADRILRRGSMAARIVRPSRFALGFAILLAAVIFSAVNLLDGGLRVLQLELLAMLHAGFEPSEDVLNTLSKVGDGVRVLAMAAVFATSYPAIGHVLRTGRLNVAHAWRLMRGNRTRLLALFLLLSVAAIALDALAAPAVNWLIRSYADELFWTFRGALVRQLVDMPFFMLWTVVYAVSAGIVLDALEQQRPAGEPRPGPPPRDAARPFDTFAAPKRRPN